MAPSFLLQLKRGYTGLAVRKGFNHAFGGEIPSLNLQDDPAISRKPEFYKTILQGGHRFIDKEIPLLVYSPYMKLLPGQLPLTGGEAMRQSAMCPFYVRRHRDHHFIYRKRNLFDLSPGEFEDRLTGIHVAIDILFGPPPLVGYGQSLNRIDVLQCRFIGFTVVFERMRRKRGDDPQQQSKQYKERFHALPSLLPIMPESCRL